ncbi:hypothetical protein Q8F57_033415 [Paraburkholderia terrae]|uniref:hypothetical protein n=1 Tax=Paraburkholderia terrae TaxID=311230 RepID=UPI00296B2933|nr:hypothetical protein [Paraburkholderia terrae]MDW3662823.1 hypothetical protein [Paraburkholderia terrae]
MEAITPDSLDVILENDRDHRTFAYLVDACGLERVLKARRALPGRTRPYVSNIAKSLGVTIPEAVVITPREEGRRRLSEIKDFLAARMISTPATPVQRN